MIHNFPWFVFTLKNVWWGGGGGGGGCLAPPHSFILQNCVVYILVCNANQENWSDFIREDSFIDFVQRRLGVGFCLDGSYTFSPAKN